MIALTDYLDAIEGFAGIAAITSGIMGLTAFGYAENSVTGMVGLSLATGLIPLGVYHSYTGLFRDKDNKSGDGSE